MVMHQLATQYKPSSVLSNVLVSQLKTYQFIKSHPKTDVKVWLA